MTVQYDMMQNSYRTVRMIVRLSLEKSLYEQTMINYNVNQNDYQCLVICLLEINA